MSEEKETNSAQAPGPYAPTPLRPYGTLRRDATQGRYVGMLRSIFRNSTIRSRLLFAFVALTLLPAIAAGAISTVLTSRNARQQIIAQLQSVATLKEAEIQTWLDNSKSDLVITSIHENDRASMRWLLQEDPSPTVFESSYNRLKARLEDIIQQTTRFEELFVLDREGTVILSTDPTQEGGSFQGSSLLQEGLKDTFVQPPQYYPSLDQTTMVVAHPIFDLYGQAIGILAGRANLDTLNTIMLERAGLGKTGETYLVSQNNHVLVTESSFAAEGASVFSQGIETALEDQVNGSGSYDNNRGTRVVGVYHWIPELKMALLAEQEQSEALSATSQTLSLGIGLSIVLVFIAVAIGLLVTRSIANPLVGLAETATLIAGGDLERLARVERGDEIGTLAHAFNSMTAQLRGLIAGLETRVATRTRDLERRSAHLEASAAVGHAAASILDTERLMHQVVELIRQRFELYYVGLFQVDESGEWAVLRAGSGEPGRAMLARGHRFRIGEGMIGWSIAHDQARIALKAEKDVVWRAMLELPLTRSEATLPLRSRGRVLGALTVQSAHPDAFDEDIFTVLQTMSDHVAVALDNAHLFAAREAAIEAMRRAYGQSSRQAWGQLLRARPGLGFHRNRQSIKPIARDDERLQPVTAPLTSHNLQLIRPIRIRDQVIGMVNASKPQGVGRWTTEETQLLETLIEQLELALEGAQLYEASQRSAQREQLRRQITEKVRAAPDVAAIAQTAAAELVQALGGTRGFVKFNSGTKGDDDNTDSTES